MSKHVILEGYTFTPATKTIVVTGKAIRKEQLLLITNTTAGAVLYNFSDSGVLATSHTVGIDTTTGLETTTIVLAYNTTSMSSTDKISILVEETYQEITPSEVLRDPVDKLRVSQPQSLIDTDFEYGQQPTKWESISLLNNRPSAFVDVTQGISNTARTDLSFYNVAAGGTYVLSATAATGSVVTVTCANTTGITNGTPIFVQGTLDPANADGWWIVDSVTGTTFTYTTTSTPAAALFDSNKTYAYIGSWYTGAAIPIASGTTAIVLNGTIGTVTTTGAHGLQPGDDIFIVGTSGASANLNRAWSVLATPTSSTFTFTCTLTGTVTSTTTSLYPRTQGYVQHRAFDGGVQFSNVKPYHGYQVFRQTRRQFRYQSGKGIQFSTGTALKPALPVDQITAASNTVTVTTKYPHGLGVGAVIKVSGASDAGYNGNTFTVASAANNTSFTYVSPVAPGSTPAVGFPLVVSPVSWYGSFNRVGMFDQQNGFFFEYDGQTIYACRRSSTAQISGVATVTNASQSVTGSATSKFSSELKPGDYIVIRGMSYLVQGITSDTQMYIYPEYRGVTASATVISKTITTRFPQSSWNIDKMDGTGASQYTLDLTRMQMLYMDYTWYGAGAIRFGFKNNRGEVIYCHRIPNNNLNTEAYMRSGNMVARYEIDAKPYSTYITASVPSSATTGGTISVADASLWPSSGTVALTQAAGATGNAIEYITYTARSNTALTIGARAQTGGTTPANTFTYSATAPIMAQLAAPQTAATLSHWGSSVIMDGRFDDDKSFVFNAGFNTSLSNLPTTGRTPLMSIRLAPSVDNGLTGLLGAREILNRMQLTLRSMDIYNTAAAFRIELLLNGRVSAGTFASVGGSSLAQIAYHTATSTISGGESIYGFFTSKDSATSQDLNLVRDIGTSILGGGTASACSTTPANLYPDGPDVITICATAIGSATNTINARLSWTEAQS